MNIKASIRDIAAYLPETVLDNAALAGMYEGWSAEKIESKTGIAERRISDPNELSSDMAVKAGEALFARGSCEPADIDYILLCTQSPDYFLPTTACLVQDRLGIPTSAGALDFNLGCSGYIYGLGLAKGLVETGQAKKVLLITSETYSKFIHPMDRSVRAIFGDAAAATLIEAIESNDERIGPFLYGTDGRGAPNLIVPTGGIREPQTEESGKAVDDGTGSIRSRDNIYMNGPEIFTFTIKTVPAAVNLLLQKAACTVEEVDRFVFHQANAYMLQHLQKKCGIPADRFPIKMKSCGNTVSSTIPLVIQELRESGELRPGMNLMLVGFGVGYSWAGCMVRWN